MHMSAKNCALCDLIPYYAIMPTWVDQPLSERLPVMREVGEGQDIEFMAEYPENGHELSVEIAGFVSSNPGTILTLVNEHRRSTIL